ncbi:hypothetical protein BKM01_08890 [Methanohalophilus portucalensis]|nr:hypothetical protein BKM01_08890 [Methanohalophilus portucalensis]SMH28590.1 hypothetical protein SAMN06264941_0063 [Methanohalophilus portucalensis FDF-1]
MIGYKQYKPSQLFLLFIFATILIDIFEIIFNYFILKFEILSMYESIFSPILFLIGIYFYLVAREKKWTQIQSLLFAIFCLICGISGVIIATYFIQ